MNSRIKKSERMGESQLIRNQHPDTRTNEEWLKEMGLLKVSLNPRPNYQRKEKEYQDDAIKELYDKGFDKRVIGLKLGISKSSVYRRLKIMQDESK